MKPGKREMVGGSTPADLRRLRELYEENSDLWEDNSDLHKEITTLRLKLQDLEQELEQARVERQVENILLEYGSSVRDLSEEEEPEKPPAPAVKEQAPPDTGQAKRPVSLKRQILQDIAFSLVFVLLLSGSLLIRSARRGAPLSIAGYSGLVVLSGSMQDVIPKDSFILTKQVDPKTLQIGDDITYMANSDTCVTHRIVEIAPQQDGTFVFRTKGVNNETVDSNPVPSANVVGKVIYSSLLLGLFARWVRDNWPLLVFLLAVWVALSWVLRRILKKNE